MYIFVSMNSLFSISVLRLIYSIYLFGLPLPLLLLLLLLLSFQYRVCFYCDFIFIWSGCVAITLKFYQHVGKQFVVNCLHMLTI